MAWHSVAQSQKLVSKSRRTLYRDMASGLVSYRTNDKGHREIETSELIRCYGDIAHVGTPKRHSVAHGDGTQKMDVLLDEIRLLRKELADMKAEMLRIELKQESASAIQTKSRWQFWKN
ncbi:entry exclusion protein 1 [Rahnella selenatireducens]|uniref:entry exclusion protein 1 n=1 Tax=Rahnella selenatireducens TaxID=3389797 RepID=UPI0039697937